MRGAGISVCAGGIIGMGEGDLDRVGLLHQLATLPEHPESVPINALVAVKGTPLQDQPPPTALEVLPLCLVPFVRALMMPQPHLH